MYFLPVWKRIGGVPGADTEWSEDSMCIILSFFLLPGKSIVVFLLKL